MADPNPAGTVNAGVDADASAITGTVAVLLLLCTIGGNLLQRLNSTYVHAIDSFLAIFLGFMAALPLCTGGNTFGLFTTDFDTVFFLFLLPPIMFESGYELNQKDFFKNFGAIVVFAMAGTLISSLVLATFLFKLAEGNMLTGLDSVSAKEALQFGALMSSTDPVATLAVLGSIRVDPQLYSIVFGESVLNDAVAIVLFQSLSRLPDPLSVGVVDCFFFVGSFLGVFLVSVLFGIACGVLCAVLTKSVIKNAHPHSEVTIMLTTAWIAQISADYCGFSGLMSVFFCGIIMSHYAKYNISPSGRDTTQNVTRVLAFIAECIVFLYFGLNVVPILVPRCDQADTFIIDWRFVAWTSFICLVSRAANIVPLTFIVNAFKSGPQSKEERISFKNMIVIWFAGLRGAVSFALSLTFTSDNRTYVIPCVVVIILISNLVFGLGTPLLLRMLGFMRQPEPTLSDESVGIDGVVKSNLDGLKTVPANKEVEMKVQGPGDESSDEWGQEVSSAGQTQTRTTMEIRQGGSKMTAPLATDAQRRGKWHDRWRRFDENFIKRFLGGRVRTDVNNNTSECLIDQEQAGGDSDNE